MQGVDVVAGEPGPIQQFWTFLREGRFMIQRSRASGNFTFYPRVMIPGTGETDLEWVEASGLGTVYATTVVPRKPERGGDCNLALVDLAEGPRMLARVEGMDPWDVKIGLEVAARVERLAEDPEDAQPLVVFYPQAEGSAK